MPTSRQGFDAQFASALDRKYAIQQQEANATTAQADTARLSALSAGDLQRAQAANVASEAAARSGYFQGTARPGQAAAYREAVSGITGYSTPAFASYGLPSGTASAAPISGGMTAIGPATYRLGSVGPEQQYADGGMVMAGDMRMNPLYQEYVKAMKNAGIKSMDKPENVIPRMAQMRAAMAQKLAQRQQTMGAQGYAEGGEVDVGGMLLDGPGTGKSDSIPAVIDGEQPAALSKGEFVIPKKVVDYYGTKFLDAMVEKAKMAMKKQQAVA